MIAGDNSRQFFIGAFVLAAMAVIAVNAYLMANLFDRPLLQRSETLKRAMLKWEQFMRTTSTPSAGLVSDIPLGNVLNQPQPDMPPQEKTTDPPKSSLPLLTGIFQVMDIHKHSEFIAILEGKRLKKNDQINQFTIVEITAKGVVLSDKGQTWFIPKPNVFYSLSK